MNLKVATITDFTKLQSDAMTAQASVVGIVDREEQLLMRVADLDAMDKADRLEEATKLITESESLVEIHKLLKDQVNRVQKRIEKISDGLRVEVLDSVRDDDEYETENYILKAKLNPPKVIVDDKKKIPKEWRRQPKPIPSWKEWEADKNAIKKALVNKEKRSIAGVSLVREVKLEIKHK